MKVGILVLALAALALGAEIGVENVTHFYGHKVYKISVKNEADFNAIVNLYTEDHYDFWTEPTREGFVDIRVTQEQNEEFQQFLSQNKLNFSVMIEDVELLVAQQRLEEKIAHARNGRAMEWTSYHDHTDMLEWLDSVAAAHPDLAEVFSIGKSEEGRDLKMIKISKGGSNNKKHMFIDAMFHAREWITAATLTWIVNEFTNNAAAHSDVLDHVDFYILPCVNPDGYMWSRNTNRMWRKTRKNHNSPLNCIGTDPNRNHDQDWSAPGASNDKCSDTYHGPTVWSEPETEAIRKYMTESGIVWDSYITIHSYGQWWLTPWGATTVLPPHYTEMYDEGVAATNALRALYGTAYTVGATSRLLYLASGGSADWAYGKLGITYSYTMELRDKGAFGFLLPPAQILPTAQESILAIKHVARHIAGQPHN